MQCPRRSEDLISCQMLPGGHSSLRDLPPPSPVSSQIGQNVTNRERPTQGSNGENEPAPEAER
jgi:hypothetical protein